MPLSDIFGKKVQAYFVLVFVLEYVGNPKPYINPKSQIENPKSFLKIPIGVKNRSAVHNQSRLVGDAGRRPPNSPTKVGDLWSVIFPN